MVREYAVLEVELVDVELGAGGGAGRDDAERDGDGALLFCARNGETVRTVVAEGNVVLLARVRVDVHELESVAVDLTPHERHLHLS